MPYSFLLSFYYILAVVVCWLQFQHRLLFVDSYSGKLKLRNLRV